MLSHAHIDHSGNLPNLVKKGYNGPIYATPATIDLCKIMLRDSAYLQEKDLEFVNIIRRRSHQPELPPLYNIHDVEKTLGLFQDIDFDKEFELGHGIRMMFRDAGHILGSASVHFEINEQDGCINWGLPVI